MSDHEAEEFIPPLGQRRTQPPQHPSSDGVDDVHVSGELEPPQKTRFWDRDFYTFVSVYALLSDQHHHEGLEAVRDASDGDVDSLSDDEGGDGNPQRETAKHNLLGKTQRLLEVFGNSYETRMLIAEIIIDFLCCYENEFDGHADEVDCLEACGNYLEEYGQMWIGLDPLVRETFVHGSLLEKCESLSISEAGVRWEGNFRKVLLRVVNELVQTAAATSTILPYSSNSEIRDQDIAAALRGALADLFPHFRYAFSICTKYRGFLKALAKCHKERKAQEAASSPDQIPNDSS